MRGPTIRHSASSASSPSRNCKPSRLFAGIRCPELGGCRQSDGAPQVRARRRLEMLAPGRRAIDPGTVEQLLEKRNPAGGEKSQRLGVVRNRDQRTLLGENLERITIE